MRTGSSFHEMQRKLPYLLGGQWWIFTGDYAKHVGYVFLFTTPEVIFIRMCVFLGQWCVRKKGSLCMPGQPYSTLWFGTFQDETQGTHGSAHRVS